jgi:acyl carrier protein
MLGGAANHRPARSQPVSMPDSEQYRADLYPALAEVAGLPVERIEGSLRLSEDLNLDSLKRIEVVSMISEKYAFDPDVETLMELRTVDDVIRLMNEHLSAR